VSKDSLSSIQCDRHADCIFRSYGATTFYSLPMLVLKIIFYEVSSSTVNLYTNCALGYFRFRAH
jgi:hypothetical protein